MSTDASQALGAPEVAGTVVSPRGLTKKAMANRTSKATPDMPSFGRAGYLAISDTELILTKTSQLGWKPHPKGDALVRVPRDDVESVELDRGRLLSHLKLTFADGVVWEFEIPLAHRKGAEELTTALGGNVT